VDIRDALAILEKIDLFDRNQLLFRGARPLAQVSCVDYAEIDRLVRQRTESLDGIKATHELPPTVRMRLLRRITYKIIRPFLNRQADYNNASVFLAWAQDKKLDMLSEQSNAMCRKLIEDNQKLEEMIREMSTHIIALENRVEELFDAKGGEES
jgi:hypothetical protein